jgi:hypothetical protein
MAYKLIAIGERGLFTERELIDYGGSYLTNMEGFPIVLSKNGYKICLKDFSILENKLIVNNSKDLTSFDLLKESHFKDIQDKAKPINAIDFIIKGEV